MLLQLWRLAFVLAAGQSCVARRHLSYSLSMMLPCDRWTPWAHPRRPSLSSPFIPFSHSGMRAAVIARQADILAGHQAFGFVADYWRLDSLSNIEVVGSAQIKRGVRVRCEVGSREAGIFPRSLFPHLT